jgi:hypothetical protein
MQSMAALGAGVALGAGASARDAARAGGTGSGEIPRRPLGRTGVEVSAIGVGGT